MCAHLQTTGTGTCYLPKKQEIHCLGHFITARHVGRAVSGQGKSAYDSGTQGQLLSLLWYSIFTPKIARLDPANASDSRGGERIMGSSEPVG
jgi:hypothetical protein